MKNSKHTMLNVLNFLKQHETDISHINRTAVAIFVFATFFVYAAAPAMAAGLAKITEIRGGGGASVSGGADGYKAQYEDRTIYFGNYWQTLKSGAPSNSNKLSDYNKEGIKWRVLANNTTADADGNKGVFLLSDKALYAYRFDSSSNRWEYSDIHTSLTGIVGNTKSSAKTYDELAPALPATHLVPKNTKQ
ncbi:MAG: hypothetical protein Q4E17_03955 [Synergistes sp.]|nr:hypothetical protein [Synergistes sp.]